MSVGRIERYGSAEWFPDSKRLLVCGAEASRAPRCYEQDLSGSPPKALTPEGVRARVAPDGRTLLLVMADGTFQLSSIDGGRTQPVGGLRAEDRQIGWSRDSRSVFVQRGVEVPAAIERVDLATGQRTLVHQMAQEGLGSITQISVTDWVDDGRWYAYNYTTIPSALFVVSGAPGSRN